jgi:hypothetical protein
MSGYIGGAIISAASAILGYTANMLQQRHNRKTERDIAYQTELQRAMREYLAALDALTLEASDHPVKPRPTRIELWLERVIKGTVFEFVGHILVRLVQRAVYGRRLNDLSDRLVAASAHLRLVAPTIVDDYMREAESIGKEHRPGDEQWNERWTKFRLRMRQVFREVLDSSISTDIDDRR